MTQSTIEVPRLLIVPRPELRPDIQAEKVGFLAGMNPWMARQKFLEPGGAAARAADEKHHILASVLHRHYIKVKCAIDVNLSRRPFGRRIKKPGISFLYSTGFLREGKNSVAAFPGF